MGRRFALIRGTRKQDKSTCLMSVNSAKAELVCRLRRRVLTGSRRRKWPKITSYPSHIENRYDSPHYRVDSCLLMRVTSVGNSRSRKGTIRRVEPSSGLHPETPPNLPSALAGPC